MPSTVSTEGASVSARASRASKSTRLMAKAPSNRGLAPVAMFTAPVPMMSPSLALTSLKPNSPGVHTVLAWMENATPSPGACGGTVPQARKNSRMVPAKSVPSSRRVPVSLLVSSWFSQAPVNPAKSPESGLDMSIRKAVGRRMPKSPVARLNANGIPRTVKEPFA